MFYCKIVTEDGPVRDAEETIPYRPGKEILTMMSIMV